MKPNPVMTIARYQPEPRTTVHAVLARIFSSIENLDFVSVTHTQTQRILPACVGESQK